jgi:tetratricopeptide (TPR) repeat protein
MKKYLKSISILGIAAMLLTGCQPKEEPLQAIYTSVEAMSYEDALAELEATEVNRGNRQEVFRLKGICHMGLGQYEEAVKALETALSYNEGFLHNVDYDINQYLAVAYANLGRFEDAQHVYSAMADLKPKDASVHFSHGIVLLELGKYADSKVSFDKAVELEPTNYDMVIEIYKALYEFGYPSLGMEYVENAMTTQSSMSDYDKGRILYHIGEYNQAVLALEKVDRKKYKDAALYLGMSYEAMGDYNYAASVYNTASGDSTNPMLYNQLGLCQLKRGAYAEALEAFTKGLECEDTSMRQSLRFNEAVAYEYQADFKTAKALFEAYLKDYPNDAEAQREYEFLKTR